MKDVSLLFFGWADRQGEYEWPKSRSVTTSTPRQNVPSKLMDTHVLLQISSIFPFLRIDLCNASEDGI